MKEGDVVLAALQQSNGQIKNRPAVVLRSMPPFGDLLVCGVSTQQHQLAQNFDELVDAGDRDFAQSGLKAPSVIRLGFLAVLPLAEILGRIGSIELPRHRRLLARLCHHLKP